MDSLLDHLRAGNLPRPDLQGRILFLSASFPSFKRCPEYRATTDLAEVSNAVVALAKAVFHANGSLVFGGHPTITPLLLSVAKELLVATNPVPPPNADPTPVLPPEPRVIAYQSSVFDGHAPSDIQKLTRLENGLGLVVRIPAEPGENPQFHEDGSLIRGSVENSLRTMRTRMIQDTQPAAAVYVGGMEGIDQEHRLAQELRIPRHYVIAAPGGAARELHPLAPPGASPTLLADLQTSRHYPRLAARIVADIVRAL